MTSSGTWTVAGTTVNITVWDTVEPDLDLYLMAASASEYRDVYQLEEEMNEYREKMQILDPQRRQHVVKRDNDPQRDVFRPYPIFKHSRSS